MAKNLEDIAKLAGVSRSTVSRVVNSDPNVGQATRERVLKVIQQANYHPNIAARSLAAGRTRILGIVIPRGVSALFSDPYFPLLIQGISSKCNSSDYSVMLWLAEPEYERRMIHKILYSGLIDGVILASALMGDSIVEDILDHQLPFILVGRYPGTREVSYVDIDNVGSARDMVMHLLRLGHKRIATITGPRNMVAGADRLEGYLAALRDRGLAANQDLIAEGDFTESGGYAAMQRLLPHKPEAVFVASDMMAMGALRAVHDAGLRVPEDMAVAGFDDMPFSASGSPSLTTVRQPVQRMGAVVAETLIDMIEHPDAAMRRLILPTEIVIRESCGSSLRHGGHLAASPPDRQNRSAG